MNNNVCFTGRGYDSKGVFCNRDAWEAWAVKHGYIVAPITHAHVLVQPNVHAKSAKSRKAIELGLEVIDYATFEHWCKSARETTPRINEQRDELAEEFVSQRASEHYEAIEGWGEFG